MWRVKIFGKPKPPINFTLSLNTESTLPSVFIIDLDQPINISLPNSTTADIASSQTVPNPEYFLIQRQIARALIARYAHLDASFIKIQKTKTGALEIYPQTGLYISLSHRGGITAFALSTHPIGIDLEIHDTKIDIPWNVLHTFERTRIERADTSKRMNIFYQIWTSKEACVKALGLGFAIAPDSFCILPEHTFLTLNKKNIDIEYKMLEILTDKTIHVSVAQDIPFLRLI